MAKAPTEIRSLARSHSPAALRTLVGIMNKRNAPASARVAAANSILDRAWGKAELRLEAEHVVRYVADVPIVSDNTEQWQQQHAPPTIQ